MIRSGRLYRYIGREYITAFIVSFIFFFFIFFVNQILVLAQKILLKNVSISQVLFLVVLSIPQFLLYTMPFSSLTAASMTIGNMSSQNEILAARSSGLHPVKIFIPVLLISLFFSAGTLAIADKMIPYSAQLYKDVYADILQSLPTLELEPYSSTQFGRRVITVGEIEGDKFRNILIYDDSDPSNRRILTAGSGSLSLINLEKMTYKIDLDKAEFVSTNSSDLQSFSVAKAENLVMNLSLMSDSSPFVTITPSQMSLTQLAEEAEKTDVNLNNGSLFWHQYYVSEMHKKIALSAACSLLVIVAFPISLFRVRNGRLIGFGLSMFIACIYWFFIYFMQVKAISSESNAAIFVWIPNAVFFIAGTIMIRRMRK